MPSQNKEHINVSANRSLILPCYKHLPILPIFNIFLLGFASWLFPLAVSLSIKKAEASSWWNSPMVD